MTTPCTICGTSHPSAHLRLFQGQYLCDSCFNARTIVCQYCGERVWNDGIRYDEGQPVCPRCLEDYFLTCSECGRVVHENEACYYPEDSDAPLCSACYNRVRGISVIQDYCYKPEPIFYGSGPRYFGVELEVDCGGESDYNASLILEEANRGHELLYCKHDGSLEDGFELVTHPMSLNFHRWEMPWRAVLDQTVQLGYYSHKTSTCGLHIHVSRDALGDDLEEQEAVIARILYFFEKNWNELLKFSRRSQWQLERWAARYGYKDHPRDILDHAKRGGPQRYACVNLTNEETIEFRIFRGTLKLNTLIATLQLVDRICDVAVFMSDKEVKALTWSRFAAGCTQPELVQYLKERRLYVNEPVVGEGEI